MYNSQQHRPFSGISLGPLKANTKFMQKQSMQEKHGHKKHLQKQYTKGKE